MGKCKNGKGEVKDPNTGELLHWDKSKSRNGQWEKGHTKINKYSQKHKDYMDGKIIKDEFLEWYQNPRNYRPESPSANRGHKFE